MTKHLYRLATNLQRSLLAVAGDSAPPINWGALAPRVMIDAWATLSRWNASGEAITRITDEQESAILADPLPPNLPLATVPIRHGALACQLPALTDWIVIARHAPAPARVTVRHPHGWDYAQPVLTYIANCGDKPDSIASGFVNLIDQPTPAALSLIPGRTIRADGSIPRLSEADITEEDYRLSLAIAALYRRRQ